MLLASLACTREEPAGLRPTSRRTHEDTDRSSEESAELGASYDFTEVSTQLGIRTPESRRDARSSYGPLWSDLNDDGWPDLIFMNHGYPLSIWINREGKIFHDMFSTSGLRHGTPEYFHQWDRHGGACADFDNDGDVDLFIAHGGNLGNTLGQKYDELLRQGEISVFDDVTKEAGTLNQFGRARLPTWIDFDNDGWLDLYIGNVETPNVLYRNSGDGTFEDVTEAAGLGDLEAFRQAWADFDLDGDMDLAVVPQLRVFRHQGRRGFASVPWKESGLRGSGKSVSWGDLNDDGWPDLFVTATWPATNRLYINDTGRFEPAEGVFGPREGEVCKGSVWGDLDNDGVQELVVGCSQTLRLLETDSTGQITMRDLETDVSLSLDSDVDVALADYDGDGFLDLAVSSIDGNHLLRNTGNTGSWLMLKLQGRASNRMGFGAKLEVVLPEGNRLHREYVGDTGFFGSSGCGSIHLGLGAAQSVDLIVRWPSGRNQRLENVQVNQNLEVVEP